MPRNENVFPFRKILVGLTRSEPDADLLAYARMLADSPGELEFHFVHVLGPPENEPDPPPAQPDRRATRKFAKRFSATSDRRRSGSRFLVPWFKALASTVF